MRLAPPSKTLCPTVADVEGGPLNTLPASHLHLLLSYECVCVYKASTHQGPCTYGLVHAFGNIVPPVHFKILTHNTLGCLSMCITHIARKAMYDEALTSDDVALLDDNDDDAGHACRKSLM